MRINLQVYRDHPVQMSLDNQESFSDPVLTSFPHLLDPYTVPTPSEATVVRSHVEHLSMELDQLKDNIARTTQYLTQLRQRAEALARTRDLHAAIVAPIRRLPSEILTEIFVHCLEEFEDGASATRAPLLLTMVCRHWRVLAITATSLWSSITLKIDGDPKLAQMQAIGATRWLQRAHMRTLKISLSDMCETIPRSIHRHPVVEAILDFVPRCVYLELNIAPRFLLAFQRASNRLFCLEKLTVRLYHLFRGPHAMDVFASAPRLRIADLFGTGVRLDLPWHRLTQLDGYPPMSKLPLCQALVKLLLFIIDNPEEEHGPVVLPRLKILRLNLMASPDATLNWFTLPSLLKLEIFRHEDAPNMHLEFFNSFATRSGFKLERLNIAGISVDVVLDILSIVPSLLSLEIDDPEILQHLVYHGPDRPLLLPALDNLTLTVTYDKETDEEAERTAISMLREVIDSRLNGSPYICSILRASYRNPAYRYIEVTSSTASINP